MKKIEQQLGGLVTRNLGSGNAFGEFDNADGDGMTSDCNDSLGNDYTLDGMKTKLAQMEAKQSGLMTNRADLITKRDTAKANYDNANNMKKGKEKEAKKAYWYPIYMDLENKVSVAYNETQAGADAITKFKLAYNCKLLKAKEAEAKRVADEKAKGNIVATDPVLASAKPMATGKLNNPPVDATASDVLKAKSEITTTSGSTTKKVLFIAGGLLLVAGVILFIRSRRK